MKKIMIIVILISLIIFFFSFQAYQSTKNFRIGIITGSIYQSDDDFSGAKTLIQIYGDANKGGIIKHITYSDNFASEMETIIAQIVDLADDPLMKAIIVNQAVPGTAEAFRKIREKYPDRKILLFAGEPHEDPNVIQSVADLAVNIDNVTRGYLIILAAKKMGADTFVHISFPRHMSYELLSRRRRIMEAACKDLGLEFVFETAPDPINVGILDAQQYVVENFPQWLKKYGNKAAFFCTNDAETEPLLKRIAELGGFFVEADLPSPLMGYPGAFGIDLSKLNGNWPAILIKVEDAVIAAGGAKRMGTWVYPYGYATTAALGLFAKRIIEGTAKLDNFKDFIDAYMKFTPGSEWNGSYYIDIKTGKKKANHILLYQDTYVFGFGYLGMTKEVIPEKYLMIK